MGDKQVSSPAIYPYSVYTLSTKGSGYACCDKSGDIDLGGSRAFTIAAWLYIDSVADGQVILSQEDGVSFYVQYGRLYLRWGTSSRDMEYDICDDVSRDISIEPGIWNYVAASYDGNGLTRYYCNGILVKSDTYSGNAVSQGKIIIGKDLYGYVRSVALYDKELSADDIAKSTYSHDTASMYLDFTCNPPKEYVSGGNIELRNGAAIVHQEYGAIFKDNGYLDITDDYPVNPCGHVGDPYSIQAWIYPEPTDKTDIMTVFVNTDTDNTAGMRLILIHKSDGLHLCLTHGVFGLKKNNVISDATLPEGKWSNVAVVYRDTIGTIYINGRLHRQEKGLFPMMRSLTRRKCFIGSDLDSCNENGVNVFTGCISRLEVWDKALSDSDVVKYMDSEPQYEDGLVGQWCFCQGNYVNTIDFEPAARRRGVGIGIGHEGHVLEASSERRFVFSDDLLQSRFKGAEIPASCREEAINTYLGYTNVSGNADLPNDFYLVNHFLKDDKIYFVVHLKQSSYIVMDSGINDLDEETIWKIEMVLIILGGVMRLFCGIDIMQGEAVKVFIITFIIGNPVFMSIIEGFTSVSEVPKVVARFLKALWTLNLLRTLLKIAFCLSFFNVLQIITGIFLKIFLGAGETLAYLASLAASIMIHMAKYPGDREKIPKITLKEVIFHSRNGYAGSRYVRSVRDISGVKRAEWRSSPKITTRPILYISDKDTERSNVPNVLHVWAEFNMDNIFYEECRFRCIDRGNPGLLGESEIVTAQINIDPPEYLHFTFPNHHINNLPVMRHELNLIWEYSFDGENWLPAAQTQNFVYIAPLPPNGPWFGNDDLIEEFITTSFFAVNGCRNTEEIAYNITRWINQNELLTYDQNEGASRYFIDHNGTEPDEIDYELITDDLNTLNPDQPFVINCLDCAVMVILFADIWGCNLVYQDLFHYLGDANLGCNLFKSIGHGDQWWRPEEGFTFHAVAVDWRAGFNNTDRRIYDACLCVNGNNPAWEQNGQAVLPAGMAYSQINGRPDAGAPNTPDDSYREHLFDNTINGAHACEMGIINNFVML